MIMEFNGKRPDVEKALFIADNAVIIGDVTLEEGVSVWFGAVIRADSGPIHIGRNSNVQDNCVLHNDRGTRIDIGEGVTIGHGAIIHGCSIEDGCLVGMGAVIMNDARVRKNSLVSAGALISGGKEFAEESLLIGCPAKALKKVSPEQLQTMKDNAQVYLEEAAAYIK